MTIRPKNQYLPAGTAVGGSSKMWTCVFVWLFHKNIVFFDFHNCSRAPKEMPSSKRNIEYPSLKNCIPQSHAPRSPKILIHFMFLTILSSLAEFIGVFKYWDAFKIDIFIINIANQASPAIIIQSTWIILLVVFDVCAISNPFFFEPKRKLPNRQSPLKAFPLGVIAILRFPTRNHHILLSTHASQYHQNRRTSDQNTLSSKHTLPSTWTLRQGLC